MCQKQTLDDQMMMRVLHFDLDNRSFITEKVNRLVFISGLYLNPRLPHNDVACVNTLAQLDNRPLLCCIDSLTNGPVLAEFWVDNDLFSICDLWRAPVRQGISRTIRSDPCDALNKVICDFLQVAHSVGLH